jgi:methionyl-tRNA synthetase
VEKNCDGKVPDAVPEQDLREKANTVHSIVNEHMSRLEFAKSLDAIFALVDQANKYLADEKPWALFKEGKKKEGEAVLYTSLEILRRSALALFAFTPQLSEKIWYQLGFDDKIGVLANSAGKDGFFDLITPGQAIRKLGPVFARIEEEGENTK